MSIYIWTIHVSSSPVPLMPSRTARLRTPRRLQTQLWRHKILAPEEDSISLLALQAPDQLDGLHGTYSSVLMGFPTLSKKYISQRKKTDKSLNSPQCTQQLNRLLCAPVSFPVSFNHHGLDFYWKSLS